MNIDGRHIKGIEAAYAIWAGACNERAVCKSLLDEIDAQRAAGNFCDRKTSPEYAAARLMAAHLAYLMGVSSGVFIQGEYPMVDDDYKAIRDAYDAIQDSKVAQG